MSIRSNIVAIPLFVRGVMVCLLEDQVRDQHRKGAVGVGVGWLAACCFFPAARLGFPALGRQVTARDGRAAR
jgi:hypothetical protein